MYHRLTSLWGVRVVGGKWREVKEGVGGKKRKGGKPIAKGKEGGRQGRKRERERERAQRKVTYLGERQGQNGTWVKKGKSPKR